MWQGEELCIAGHSLLFYSMKISRFTGRSAGNFNGGCIVHSDRAMERVSTSALMKAMF